MYRGYIGLSVIGLIDVTRVYGYIESYNNNNNNNNIDFSSIVSVYDRLTKQLSLPLKQKSFNKYNTFELLTYYYKQDHFLKYHRCVFDNEVEGTYLYVADDSPINYWGQQEETGCINKSKEEWVQGMPTLECFGIEYANPSTYYKMNIVIFSGHNTNVYYDGHAHKHKGMSLKYPVVGKDTSSVNCIVGTLGESITDGEHTYSNFFNKKMFKYSKTKSGLTVKIKNNPKLSRIFWVLSTYKSYKGNKDWSMDVYIDGSDKEETISFDLGHELTHVDSDLLKKQLPPECQKHTVSILWWMSKGKVPYYEVPDGEDEFRSDKDEFWSECAELMRKNNKIKFKFINKSKSFILEGPLFRSNLFHKENEVYSNPWYFVPSMSSELRNIKIRIGSTFIEGRPFNERGEFFYFEPSNSNDLFKIYIKKI
eukprot:GHVR01048459.1.p1 GENE.GHVR01048459.1~~GHVR01048459.1.p1  ORF type:complete len:423 (+),score=71.29 GHVR01048459.1:87-1355(+)